MNHIVLLGHSIFDNGAYVHRDQGGEPVPRREAQKLTRCATDSYTVAGGRGCVALAETFGHEERATVSEKRPRSHSQTARISVDLPNCRAIAKKSAWRLASVAIAALLGSGCIAARPFTLVKYDAKSDTFRELRIYVDIAGGTADPNKKMTAEGLVELWRRPRPLHSGLVQFLWNAAL